MGTNYIAPIWRMPENTNKDKLSNYSIDFNGTDEYIDCGNSSNIDITGALSISFWIKAPNQTQFRGIVSKAVANTTSIVSNSQYNIEVFGTTSKSIRCVVTGVDLKAGTETTGTVPSLDFDQWQHIVMTWNGTNEMIVYNNGTQAATKTQSSTITSLTDNLFIGKRNRSSGQFEGKIAQVCIFNYALNSTQVTYLYNLNNPMAISGGEPVAYWPLGDNSNPNAPGSFPNISVGADSVFNFIPNDYIDCGTSSDLEITGNLTLSAWIYLQSGSAYQGIISKRDSGGTNYQLYTDNSATPKLRFFDGSTPASSTGNVSLNAWHHIAITVDSGVTNGSVFYIDGVDSGTATFTITSNDANLLLAAIDTGTVGSFLNGKLSNIQIWDTALELSDVEDLYNNGQPLMTGTQPQAANLQGWWKLNQSATWTGSAWSIPDASTNSNTGTSVGMDTTNLVQSNLTRTQPYSDYSINFDANSLDYIQVANPGNIIGYGESAFTFSGWINADAIGAQDGIFGRYQDASNRVTIKTGITSPYDGITLQIQNGSTNGYSEWTNIITTGQWYHICAVYDGPQGAQSNRLKLYLNGVDQGTRSTGFGTIPTTVTNMTASTPLDICNDRRLSGRLFDGKVSNYCVFDRVLTDAEILKIYNNGITQDLQATSSFSNNILAWWPMDASNSYYDGTNWTVRDLQGGKDGD